MSQDDTGDQHNPRPEIQHSGNPSDAQNAAAMAQPHRLKGRDMVQAITIVFAPLIIGVLAAVALSVPDQTREIYRLFARDYAYAGPVPAHEGWPEVLSWAWQRLAIAPIDFSWIGALAAGILNWVFARNLTLLFARDYIGEKSARGVALRWLPRLCGALIPIGAGTGLMMAASEIYRLPFDVLASPSAPRQDDAAENLRFMGYFFYALAFALIAFAYFRTFRRRGTYAVANRWLFSTSAVLTMLAVSACLMVLFSAPLSGSIGVIVAWTVGAPALFCLFTAVFAYFTTGLSIMTLATGVPVIPLVALYVLFLALADVNDNHAVTIMPSAGPVARPSTRQAFLEWYRSRADRSLYESRDKPYPVFLVSAAGGGLYAADFAGTALARLQDGCPAFAQHTFAISGVSGGGFGAALFTTLLAGTPQIGPADIVGSDPCQPRPSAEARKALEPQIGTLVTQDYLAPVVAAGLFADFPQRLFPYPVPFLDRSRAFNATLDLAWQRLRPGCTNGACQPFAQPFLTAWTATNRAPALVLNTTNVDVGYRTVISPFVIARDVPGEYSALQNFHEALSGKTSGPTSLDVSLATAIGLSTRFPWLMPAGTLALPNGKPKLRLLDGGIFENSGADTLSDMLIDLADLERPPATRPSASRGEPWIEFHPLIISGYQLNSDSRDTGFRGEVLSPVSAMLSARVQRAGMASYRLFLKRGYHCGKAGQSDKCGSGGLRFLVLNHEDFRLPLGWQLSTFTRSVVRHHVGDYKACDPIPRIRDMFTGPSSYQRQQYTLRENNCTACAVRQVIAATPLEGSTLCRSN